MDSRTLTTTNRELEQYCSVKRHNVVLLFRFLPPGFDGPAGASLTKARLYHSDVVGRGSRVGPNAFS